MSGPDGLVVNAGASATGDCNVGEGVNLLAGVMNVVADPAFTTTARGYYRLDDTSPAIDLCGTGADTDLDTCDRPYGVDEDAGAFEWNDGTCP